MYPLDESCGREAAAWTEELPWHPVGPDEPAALVAAYRRARLVATELRAILVAAGVDANELRSLCASVDEAGEPVVVLGQISADTAELLCRLLGRPTAA